MQLWKKRKYVHHIVYQIQKNIKLCMPYILIKIINIASRLLLLCCYINKLWSICGAEKKGFRYREHCFYLEWHHGRASKCRKIYRHNVSMVKQSRICSRYFSILLSLNSVMSLYRKLQGSGPPIPSISGRDVAHRFGENSLRGVHG